MTSFPPKESTRYFCTLNQHTQRLGHSRFRWCNHSASPFAIHPFWLWGWHLGWPKKQLLVRCNRCGYPRGNVGFLLVHVGSGHGSQLYHPTTNGCIIWLPIFEFDSKKSGLPTWPANNIQPQFLSSQGGGVGTGHRRVYCQTRRGFKVWNVVCWVKHVEVLCFLCQKKPCVF